jgi:hypothetical protein
MGEREGGSAVISYDEESVCLSVCRPAGKHKILVSLATNAMFIQIRLLERNAYNKYNMQLAVLHLPEVPKGYRQNTDIYVTN